MRNDINTATTGSCTAGGGFIVQKFSMIYNATQDSLDFVYNG
jgi:hypothetical protein